MNINLHIEHLILTGVDIQSHQKDKLGAAVTAELTRQIMDRGISSTFHSHSHNQSVSGGTISLGTSTRPATLGQKIGNAVYKGIGK